MFATILPLLFTTALAASSSACIGVTQITDGQVQVRTSCSPVTSSSSKASATSTIKASSSSTVKASATTTAAYSGPKYNVTYSTVGGYFLQDLNSTDPSTFDYTAVNFGLINQTYIGSSCYGANYTQWQKFAAEVARLNIEAPRGTEYKLLFIGRHGEGFHNAAETFYGTPAWNCYWAEVNGNATADWEDAKLTANGIAQAQKANAFWQSEVKNQKITLPQSFYTSPLYRCLATANLTYGAGLELKHGFQPTIKELLREGVSIHTCDHRSNKTYIHNSFPAYKFEPGFKEYDELWNGVTTETGTAQDVRSKALLDDVFTNDDSTYISMTTHSGEAASILRVLGHRTFSLVTGAIVPVLVKAVFKQVPTSSVTPTPAWTPSPHCTVPPVSSISGGACVCPNNAQPVTNTLVNDVSPATVTNYHTTSYVYSTAT